MNVSQAAQSESAALGQHQHLAAAETQATQGEAVSAVQHQHATVAASQPAQGGLLAGAQHQHAAVTTGQSAQAATSALQQTQYMALTGQQPEQESLASIGEEVAVNGMALVTEQTAQASQVVASAAVAPPVIVPDFVGGGYLPRPRPVVVNGCSIETQQAAQESRGEIVRDTNYLTALFDLDEDFALVA